MRLIRSLAFACKGLKICFATETNFRIQVFLAITTISLGIGLHISTMEWLVVSLCTAIVLSAELMNTAIEKLADVVHQDIHSGIKLVKDISAGAVLVSALLSFVNAGVIFFPKIIHLIKSIQ